MLKSSLHKQPMVRFAAVGLLSTLLDVGVYRLLLHFHMVLFLAVAIGFMVGLTNGYFLNTRFVFAKEHNVMVYNKYALVSLGALGLTEGIIYLLSEIWKVMDNLEAKLVAVVLVFFWNYFLSKHWAFK